jgi:putative sigma-54 modulation protein
MNISYKGMKQELSPKIEKKMDAKFAKISKLLEKKGEKEAHVVVTSERHLYCVEITVQYYGHQLIGKGSDTDLLNALSEACEKLEIQAVKTRGRWREKHRRTEAPAPAPEPAAPKGKAVSKAKATALATAKANGAARIFKVNHHEKRKPMTLDEAVMEMEQNQDYLVYRDADDGVRVLVRRRDGHLDLIEG